MSNYDLEKLRIKIKNQEKLDADEALYLMFCTDEPVKVTVDEDVIYERD